MSVEPKPRWNPERFDVCAFAQAGAHLHADDPLPRFERLAAELPSNMSGDGPVVCWQVRGEQRPGSRGAEPSIWLHLKAQIDLPLPCQRCLSPVQMPLAIDRWFRFVAHEQIAAAEDEHSHEDVLAWEPRPSLLALIEDELLMALPPVPMHQTCPEPLQFAAGQVLDAELQQTLPRSHPFAELARLKR